MRCLMSVYPVENMPISTVMIVSVLNVRSVMSSGINIPREGCIKPRYSLYVHDFQFCILDISPIY